MKTRLATIAAAVALLGWWSGQEQRAAADDAYPKRAAAMQPSFTAGALARWNGTARRFEPSAEPATVASVTAVNDRAAALETSQGAQDTAITGKASAASVTTLAGRVTALEGKGNAQFSGTVNTGTFLSIGATVKNITVSGVLATDRLNCMPTVDPPAGVTIANCRPTADNAVRVYISTVLTLITGADVALAITALR